MSFLPDIPATKVAGLIGRHPYQAYEEVAYAILKKDSILRSKIAAIEKAHNRSPLSQVSRNVTADRDIKNAVWDTIRACDAATDTTDAVAALDIKAAGLIAAKFGHYSPELQKSLVEEVRGQVAKNRGLKQENTILNHYSTEEKVEVTERNTTTKVANFGTFVLNGRVDGLTRKDGATYIVDSKARMKNRLAPPPEYDIIQMRVYMELWNSPGAILVEKFPNGAVRNTSIHRETDTWLEIEGRLREECDKLMRIAENDEEIKRIVFANTVGT